MTDFNTIDDTPEPEEVGEFYEGELDERTTDVLTVTRVDGPYPSDWGDRFCIRFKSEDGCVLVWWTGEGHGYETGWSGEVKFTVKDFDVYLGQRQTRINRVKRVTDHEDGSGT